MICYLSFIEKLTRFPSIWLISSKVSTVSPSISDNIIKQYPVHFTLFSAWFVAGSWRFYTIPHDLYIGALFQGRRPPAALEHSDPRIATSMRKEWNLGKQLKGKHKHCHCTDIWYFCANLEHICIYLIKNQLCILNYWQN